MKTLTLPHFLAILFLSFLILTVGCKKDDPIIPLKVTLNDPTEVTETSFIANWSVNRTDIESTSVEVSLQNDFSALVKKIIVSNASATSQVVDGLNGASRYYYKITVTLTDNTSTSSVASVNTSYQTESIIVVASDGILIKGNLYYLNSTPVKSPTVILMGVFSLSNQWKGTEVFYELLASGYVCCTFNYRGHGGGSDPWPINELYDDLPKFTIFVNKHTRNDLWACYTYLKNHQKVDSTRIGLMGGSLGANESMIGNHWPGVKCSVGLSTSRLGIEEGLPLHNVLFIASDQDCNEYICFDEEAQYLYNGAHEPKRIVPIVPGDYHALDLLGLDNVNQEIIDWIKARMNDE